MPTYIYRREDGTTFECVQRITEDPLTTDPETGQKVQRVISGAGLIFKGDGFYLTDYVKKKGGSEKKEDKPDAKAPVAEKKSEEAKPAKAAADA